MQFQPIFDNLCRCFGHPAPQNSVARTPQTNVTRSFSASNSQSSKAKRRTNRVELNTKEYDALFEEGKRFDQSSNDRREQPDDGAAQQTPGSTDVDQARALAKAKLAANPSRYRSKRKRSGKAKEEIFRLKDTTAKTTVDSSACGASGNPSTLSRLLNPSVALCFATPVRDSDEPDEIMLRSQDASDAGTLNTCEDTITSTLYFDNKYSHLVESRPPMPLFNQFKLGHQKDEIRTIIELDSHSSLKMIDLMQEVHHGTTSPHKVKVVREKAFREIPRPQQQHNVQVTKRMDIDQDMDMDDVPDVKACSTDSSSNSIQEMTSRIHT